MSETLDVHVASESERIQAYRNVHEFWGGGARLEEYVEHRVKSVKHRRATWFVGCRDGRVVTSLGCYPIEFRLNSRVVAGIALGAVHTLPDDRGKGFAPQLIQFTEDFQRERGAGLSLLYSDVEPAYYARLGYQECPCWAGWAEPALKRATSKSGQLKRVAAPDQAALLQLYDSYHAPLSLAIARSPEYWDHLGAREPDDEFFWLTDSAGERAGYARLGRTRETIFLRDYALAEQTEQLADEFCSALLRLAADESVARIGGWLPQLAATGASFEMAPRDKEITMIKALDRQLRLDEAAIESAQYFHEIDHV